MCHIVCADHTAVVRLSGTFTCHFQMNTSQANFIICYCFQSLAAGLIVRIHRTLFHYILHNGFRLHLTTLLLLLILQTSHSV